MSHRGTPTQSRNPEEWAVRIISRTGPDRPTDTALREELREARGLPREDSRTIAQRVFAFERWKGWLDPAMGLRQRIEAACELAARFEKDPSTFSAEELSKAVPPWVFDHVTSSEAWLRSLQAEPPLWIRVRPGTAEVMRAELPELDEPNDLAPDALRYRGTTDLFRSPLFQAGRFEVQDLSSQIVSLVAAPKPGQSWWDACAGEGGKTLHLADLMENRGVVWATERAEWRLKRLRMRANRAGLFNVRWAVWNPPKTRPVKAKYDGVLVDAPCTGVGTWQRNPHARWTTTPADVEELARIQLDLLRSVASNVKPGGRLVYAVCTLTRAETTGVTNAFEASVPGFKPLALPPGFRRQTAAEGNTEPSHTLTLWPQDWDSNGMYIAAWQRTS